MLLATSFLLITPILAHKECYSNLKNPYLFFGTRTLYRDAGKALGEVEHPEKKFQDCEPIRAWLYVRHGARYPGKHSLPRYQLLETFAPEIIENHHHGRGWLCREDLDLLKKWRVVWTASQARLLTPRGEQDTFQFGVRLKKRFPKIFNRSYNPDLFKFYASDTVRCTESTLALGRGLFNTSVYFPTPVENDPMCRPYKNCTKWRYSNDNFEIIKEEERFNSGEEIKAVVENVSTRLGFNHTLPKDTVVKMIYDACRYDRSFYPGPSPWCAAFSKQDLQVLEYALDIKVYHELSYGNKLNFNLGCVPLKNMMDWIQRVSEDKNSEPIAKVFTTHSVMLMVLLTSLGIAKENLPLMHDNFSEQKNRTFRSSYLNPGTANVVAVFFRCRKSSRVLLLVNERPMKFPECPDGMCPVSVLKKKFDRPCPNLVDWCTSSSSNVLPNTLLLYFIINFFVFALNAQSC